MTRRILATGLALAVLAGCAWWLLSRGTGGAVRDAPVRTAESGPITSPVGLQGRGTTHPTPDAPSAAFVPSKASVVAVVLDESDSPRGGAEVTLRPHPAGTSSESPAAAGPVVSATDGTARFDALPAGEFHAVATLAGFETAYAGGVARDGAETRVKLVLRALVPILGRVLLPSGEPAQGASVTVTRGGAFGAILEAWGQSETLAHAVSGPEGEFRLEVPSGQILTVTASLADHAPASVAIRRLGPGEEIVLALAAGGSIRGAVRAPDGSPCAGASVFLVPADEPALLEDPRCLVEPDGSVSSVGDDDVLTSWSMARTGETGTPREAVRQKADARGAYVFTGIPVPGSYRTLAEGCPGARGASPVIALTESSRVAVADVLLESRVVLVVRLQGPDGKPSEAGGSGSLEGARDHFLEPRGPGTLYRLGSNSDRLRFAGLLPGSYVLHVEMPGSLPISRPVDVGDGVTEISVRGDRGLSISGVLVDRAGQPVAEAQVTLAVPAVGTVAARWPATQSIADGKFTISGLHDVTGTLQVDHRRFLPVAQEGVGPGSGSLRIVLRARPEIRGRLVPTGTSVLPQRIGLVQWTDLGSVPDSVEVAASGEFRYVTWSTGEAVTLVLASEGTAPVYVGRLSLQPEEVRDLGSIPFTDGRTVQGRVVDESGVAVVGVVVGVHFADAQEGLGEPLLQQTEASTSADGRFTLRHVSDAPVVLKTSHAPYAATRTSVVGSSETEIRLVRGARVTGRIVDDHGGPHGATLWFRDEEDPVAWKDIEIAARETGTFTSPLLRPVRYAVLMQSPEQRQPRPLGHITLVPGESRTVEWTVP